MQLHPTRSAVDVALGASAAVVAGLLMRQPAVLAWGGALLLGLAIARAVTQFSVARIRAAGFEMLWREEARVRRLCRGESIELRAEVRNRDTRAARYVALRPVCSPDLDVRLEPDHGEVPAAGRLSVTVTVIARRVGNHGIYGLSLEVQGSPGLYEVPLTFANPFGFEVMPATQAATRRSPRGGRSRRIATEGLASRRPGESLELRELREHQPGDPFKRIAWKASARRGRLMVREYEQEDRALVVIVLDAAAENWAGPSGAAPMDRAIERAAELARTHLQTGDSVGLVVVGHRVLAEVTPDRGPGQAQLIDDVLAHRTGVLDADRSEEGEGEVAVRVAEHLRPLEGSGRARIRASDLDRLARRASELTARAPLEAREVTAPSPRETTLRAYLSAYGVRLTPSRAGDRQATDVCLLKVLAELRGQRPRPSIVYVVSAPPDERTRPGIRHGLAQLPLKRLNLRWAPPAPLVELGDDATPHPALAELARTALELRERAAHDRGLATLKKLSIVVDRGPQRRSRGRPFAATGDVA